VIWIADQSEHAATISSRRVRLPGLMRDLGNAPLRGELPFSRRDRASRMGACATTPR